MTHHSQAITALAIAYRDRDAAQGRLRRARQIGGAGLKDVLASLMVQG